MQDTAEQVLARLERYVAARPAPPPVRSLYRTGMPFAVAQPDVSRTALSRAASGDTLVPSRTPASSGSMFLAVALATTLATSSCALTIALFQWLDPGAAIVGALALILVAVVGRTRRVPFISAWTTGLAVGVLLVRFS